jgi:hypothetical protein
MQPLPPAKAQGASIGAFPVIFDGLGLIQQI